ncbi:hypothetical protein [Massilia antarctica]|uniref:hypothetical protein n=1 Tax=Massilia antarctica TaxID=2765360 RepID=UPI00226FF2C5|nr:hypothetical protein [Massilia sp. H27-R4]MCY0914043.1 hypothetical protein [Massilia sp. H27-R4]
MTETQSTVGLAEQKQDAMWAKIDDGRWYAIPPSMAESFRKAGAEVRQARELPQ